MKRIVLNLDRRVKLRIRRLRRSTGESGGNLGTPGNLGTLNLGTPESGDTIPFSSRICLILIWGHHTIFGLSRLGRGKT